MSDLDPTTAAALCEALSQPLSLELGQAVACVDVSQQMARWDLEAHDVMSGMVLRRLSHTRTVCQRLAKLLAEVGKEFRPALEAELARLGVCGHWVFVGVRSFPDSRTGRRGLAVLLAERIREHLAAGVTLLEEPFDSVRAGREPFSDELSKYLYSVRLVPMRQSGRARVAMANHDGLAYVVVPLRDEVLPAIARKKVAHGSLLGNLSLVVEVMEADLNDESVVEARLGLSDDHIGFCSIYLAHRRGGGPGFEVSRLS